MATQLYLSGVNAISGGILNLNGGNIELLAGWQPRVAKRRRGVLGGNRYENVVESIPLRVFGASAADCVRILELIAGAMDQARSWRDNEPVDAVVLNYAINGTTLTNPLQAAVLGTPIDAADILGLPITFNSHLQVFEVNPVTLPLERRGQWLGDEDAQSSGAVAEPGKMTATFSSAPINASPVDVQIAVSGAPSVAAAPHGGFVIFVDDASDIAILEGEAATKSNFTTHADAGASGGNVAIMNTGVTSGTLTWTSPSINADARLYALIAMVRTNLLGEFECRHSVNPATPSFGPIRNISLYGPSPLFLGLVSTNEAIRTVQFRVETDTSVTSGNELELDYLAIVAMRENTRIIGVSEFSQFSVQHREDHYFLHRLLTKQKPIYYQFNGSINLYPGYQGVLPAVMNSDEFTGLIMVGGDDGNTWSTGEDYILTATRRPAYLVPQ